MKPTGGQGSVEEPHRQHAVAALVAMSLVFASATPGWGEPALDETQGETVNQAEHDKRVDYVEFFAPDLEAIKEFYGGAFGWEFTDWGSEYISFHDGRLGGGFRIGEAKAVEGGPLVILYAVDLEAAEASVKAHGGEIVIEIFEFPGGRRFHFTDPAGNQLAVWSDN